MKKLCGCQIKPEWPESSFSLARPLSGLHHLSAPEPDECDAHAHTKREATALSFPQTTIRAANVVNRQLARTNDP